MKKNIFESSTSKQEEQESNQEERSVVDTSENEQGGKPALDLEADQLADQEASRVRATEIVEQIKGENMKEERHFTPSLESIAALEDLKSVGISWQNKLEVFLAACEIKPATHLPIFALDSQDQETIEQIFRDLKLEYVVARREPTDPNDGAVQGEYLDYIVSHSSKNLERARKAYVNLFQESTADETVFGLALGFPETAVEAFQKTRNEGLAEKPDSPLLHKEEYEQLLTSEERSFTFFKLSRAHWQEELKWIHKIIEISKKHAPKIYSEILREG